jgi:hypothetical protein
LVEECQPTADEAASFSRPYPDWQIGRRRAGTQLKLYERATPALSFVSRFRKS